MYYLLEDNRIIEELPLQTVIVKNQSKNVFDLIDWEEDIIRITWSDGKSFILYCDISKSDFSDGYYSLDWITAIYKPDEKGNYIKVWEKKEGE